MTNHEAEEYTLSVRREVIEGSVFYVARVEELPDVQEFSESYAEARELALDTIRTSQAVYFRQGREFPVPKSFDEPLFSGRITLRLRKTTHARAVKKADCEGVSLNSFIAACIEKECATESFGAIELQIQQLQQLILDINEESSIGSMIVSGFLPSSNSIAHRIGRMLIPSKMHFPSIEVNDDIDEKDEKVINLFSAQQDIRYAYD